MKRFTDTDKWEDAWYQDLPLKYKMFWNYLCDKCSHFGVWKVNMKYAIFAIGEPFELSELKRVFHERIVVLENGDWFIPKFISFQYGNILSRESLPVRKVISFLEDNPDLLRFLPKITISERVTKGLPKGCKTLKDKDKEKDKEQYKDKEQEQEENSVGKPPAKPKKHKTEKFDMFDREENELFNYYKFGETFKAKWNEWKTYRKKEKRNPITTDAMRRQLKLLDSLENPIEVMQKSMDNGWIGLFGEKTRKYYYKTDLGEELEVIHGLVEVDGMKFSVPNDRVYTK